MTKSFAVFLLLSTNYQTIFIFLQMLIIKKYLLFSCLQKNIDESI